MFGKKKTGHLGYWIMVAFSDHAKENAVGNYFLKKIYHFWGRSMLSDKTENYTEAKVKMYVEREIPVIDATVGQQIPMDSMLTPKEQVILGTVQLTRRV